MKDSPVDPALTERVIKSFYSVYDDLGYGFLEAVYRNALAGDLTDKGIRCQQEAPFEVTHKGRVVGVYRADLIVEKCVIVEVKSSEFLPRTAERQLLHYLKATGIQLGYVFHFGPEAHFHRRILTRTR